MKIYLSHSPLPIFKDIKEFEKPNCKPRGAAMALVNKAFNLLAITSLYITTETTKQILIAKTNLIGTKVSDFVMVRGIKED
ncbi:hypothetical protein [Nostoc sp.]|uniref:hypothetical protein n=1 Tax=Nostoc sp. TaxID=1180 RepID=UPI002FF6C361